MKTIEPETFQDRLLPMLRKAAERPRGVRSLRSRPTALLLVAMIGAAVAGGVVWGGVAIGRSEIVQVSGQDALRNPSAVERMLRDSGIDADIVEVPLPSTPDGHWNGVWWWLYFEGPAAVTEEEFADLQAQVGLGGIQPDADNTTVLELPKGLPGHVTLLVGREAAPGAFDVTEYDRINELAPTGAFYCLGLDPRDPAALGQALVQRGYRVMWNYEDLDHNVGREVAAPPDGTVATWAWFRGPKLVDVRIVDDGPEAQTYREAEGTFVPGETPPWAPPCS